MTQKAVLYLYSFSSSTRRRVYDYYYYIASFKREIFKEWLSCSSQHNFAAGSSGDLLVKLKDMTTQEEVVVVLATQHTYTLATPSTKFTCGGTVVVGLLLLCQNDQSPTPPPSNTLLLTFFTSLHFEMNLKYFIRVLNTSHAMFVFTP